MMLSAGTTKLQMAAKTLRVAWEESQAGWKDRVREQFEEQHLRPIMEETTAVLREMESLALALGKAHQECA